jgi:glyoxylase-like metal-dependent hydrolase (beta-lactamase superfamily II)
MFRFTAYLARGLLLAACLMPLAARADAPKISAHALNDYLLFFYAGRDPEMPAADDWVSGAAMKLGIGIYVIHQGNEALIYDTMTSPEQSGWIKEYLKKMGIEQMTVVQSHWHLDHIGGNASFKDHDIVALEATRQVMLEKKAAIEAGEEWGPPAINPMIAPNILFEDRLKLYVGDIEVRLLRFDIHTRDANLLYLPADKIMLTGDALEDPLTYMVEIEGLPTHLKELQRLKAMDIARIYPNHGDPDVIVKGGYDKTFIDATSDYIRQMLTRHQEPGYLDSKMEDFIGDSLAKGWVHPWPPYQDVHKMNTGLIHEYYQDKPMPALD